MTSTDGGGDDVAIQDEYLRANFDIEAHAQKLLEGGAAIGDQLAVLSANAAQLDKQLKKQITSHHGKLLTQATSIESLESILETLTHHISALKSGAERISNKTFELFDKTETQTLQLSRMHETCNLLRALIRIIQLGNRLQAAGRDMVKTSQVVNEMTEIVAEMDLHGISIVEKDLAHLPIAAKELKTEARSTLMQGLRSQHHAVVGNALLVLSNMKCLDTEMTSFFSSLSEEIDRALGSLGKGATGDSAPAKKSAGPGAAAGSQNATPSSVLVRANLWTDVQRLVDTLLSACSQMDVICAVLLKKKHALTHRPLAEQLTLSLSDLCHSFWKGVGDAMAKRLTRLTGLVKQTLESEYPKFLRLFSDVFSRLAGNAAAETVYDARRAEWAACVRTGLSALETAYLSKSVSRLFDSVNLGFGADNAPTDEEIDQVGKIVTSELDVALFDPTLCTNIGVNVAKTIKLFAVKCEQLLSTDGDASQVIGRPSPGQRRNVAVVNALYKLRSLIGLQVTRQRHSAEIVDNVMKACEQLTALMKTAVEPLMQSIEDAVAAIIDTMHQEDFSFGVSTSHDGQGQQCSLYMRELQGFVARVTQDHLSAFACKELVHNQGALVARKACRLFILHATLVRPVGDGGRLRLAADFAQMELAVSPLCVSLSADLGPEYATLRAVRPLLFQRPAEIAVSEALGRQLPYWLAIHLLISLSPPELLSPHVSAGWSVARYTEWFEEHPSDAERLQFLRGTCEAYAMSVAAQNKTEYVDTYPLLLDLLKRGAESINVAASSGGH
uniref:Conserved oligomeric Golgi complex subunit 5 n=1 Tax=Plectus sambesii TaxID=2011161 RepID=A0A914W6Q3_9BILA